MTDLDGGGEYINALIMDRMLMDQKKNFQFIMEQQNKKIDKLKRTVGKLNNKIEFLKAKNEKQHKEHCVKLCDQEKEFRVIAKILKRNGQELKSTFTKVMKQLINPSEEKAATKYFAVEGVPQRYYVSVYKALEQRHADLAMRFLNINDEWSIDTTSDLIDTFQYIPTMFKHSLGIMCALTDYTPHKQRNENETIRSCNSI